MMDLNKALDIHFKNLGFATPYDKGEIEDLKLNFYELYDEGLLNLDEHWYMRELAPDEFLGYLAIDALENIYRRDIIEPLPKDITQHDIKRIEHTTDYRNLARICLNIMDGKRYGIV